MELKDTIDGMLSTDHKERLKAEYQQLKIRIGGLEETLRKYYKGCLNFPLDAKQVGLMSKQLSGMMKYRRFLELRAINDNIDLSE